MIKNSFLLRLPGRSLRFSAATLMAALFLIGSQIASAASPPPICTEIRNLLKKRQRAMLLGRVMENFEIEYQSTGGGGDSYLNLDIDLDGKSDVVERSCGGSIDAPCYLFVDLSGGRELELEEKRFFLVRVRSVPYVVVGESISEPEAKKRGKRRIYQIGKQSIDLICPHL